jgi:hypothetical protein
MTRSVWIDRRRDIVHLNWWRIYDADEYRDTDPFPYGLPLQTGTGRGASLIEGLFDVDLVGGMPSYDPYRGPYDTYIGGTTLLLCLHRVCIHTALQPAVESGLFGLLGEERIKRVDADDTERKEQERAFWERHGLRPDLNPYQCFQQWSSQNDWLQGVWEDKELAYIFPRWLEAKSTVFDPYNVWEKRPHDGDDQAKWKSTPKTWLKRYWTINKEHLWVKKILPRIRLTEMFRLCTNNCREILRAKGWTASDEYFVEPAV